MSSAAKPAQITTGRRGPGPRQVRGSLADGLGNIAWKPLLQVALIIAAVFWIYGPVVHGEWLWDDDIDITLNPVTRSASGLWDIWFVPGSELDYYPIKATVQWLQWHAWGMDTTGYHVTNIVLHAIGALLVWRFLARLGLRLAWLGGLIFAVHPAQVESVAWITELKNTLAMPLFLLAMIAWIDFEDRDRRARDYALALVFFILAMLTKPAMAPFPVVILLYAWWKRGRIDWGDAKAAAPFFAISVALGVLSLVFVNRYWHIHEQANGVIPLGGFFSHAALIGLDLAFYFGKAVWPVGFLPYYPQWPVNPPSLLQFWPWPVMAAVAWACWRARATWGRHALLGLGYFVIMLAPFVVFNVGGYASYTWVFDHFLYFPILGLIGLAVAALGALRAHTPHLIGIVSEIVLAAVLVVLAWGSREYATMFTSGEKLCAYGLTSDPDCWVLQYNYAVALAQNGHTDEAIAHYLRTLQLRPNDIDASYNLGILMLQLKRPNDAISYFEETVKYAPNDVRARNNLGGALMEVGRRAEAIEQFEAALNIRPNFTDARFNLGSALAQEGRRDEAIAQFHAVLNTNPQMVPAYLTLGVLLGRMGRTDEARALFEKALEIDPGNDGARNDLGWLQNLNRPGAKK